MEGSLVPSFPSFTPVQFLNSCNVRESLLRFITSDISVYLGGHRGEGSLIQRMSLKPFFVTSPGVSNICEAKIYPLLVQNEEHVYKCILGSC